MTRDQEYKQLNDLLVVLKKNPFSRSPDVSEVLLSEAIYHRSKTVIGNSEYFETITLKSKLNNRRKNERTK